MSTESDRLYSYLRRLDEATDRCVSCGKKSQYLNDEYVCADCLIDETFLCDICNAETDCKNLAYSERGLLCPKCHNEIEKEER